MTRWWVRDEIPSLHKFTFTGEYGPIEDVLVDLYKKMEHHSLKSAQMLNLLYACSTRRLAVFRFGRAFKKGVEPYLKGPIED